MVKRTSIPETRPSNTGYMLRILFLLIILLHGLIHCMGFAKAWGYADMKQLTLPISKTTGVAWLCTALLFLTTALLFSLKDERWIWTAVPATVLSQVLIVWVWQDAKWGTIVNILVITAAALSYTTLRFEKAWQADVRRHLARTNSKVPMLVTEEDLLHLPAPVQRYLHYSGVVGKARPLNMYVRLKGKMRSKTQDWFSFSSEQYNFFDEPARLFFMKATLFGLTVPGYHRCENGKATMAIRLFGLIPVLEVAGTDMSKGETVTLFNDMCLLAPSSLLDERIRWEQLNDQAVKAEFSKGNIVVSAVLYFSTEGRLINFTSNDRFEVHTQQYLPFSTPVTAYQTREGRQVLLHAEAVWHYGKEAFTYGQFELKDLRFDVRQLQ